MDPYKFTLVILVFFCNSNLTLDTPFIGYICYSELYWQGPMDMAGSAVATNWMCRPPSVRKRLQLTGITPSFGFMTLLILMPLKI